MVENLDSESEQVQATFAYFGAAVYMANVIEIGLAHVIMTLEFFQKTRDEFGRNKEAVFERTKYEADFEAFMENQFKKTMGQLKAHIEKHGHFEDHLKRRIEEAINRRNFLSHHFWRERSFDFCSPEGRARMNEELKEDAKKFDQLEKEIQNTLIPIFQKLGINVDSMYPSGEDYRNNII